MSRHRHRGRCPQYYGLRRELQFYGIDVLVVVPGSVRTPLWDRADQLDAEQYADTDYVEMLRRMQKTVVAVGREGMPVETVSRTVRVALEARKPKTHYVLANNWLFGWILPRLISPRWLDRIVGRQWGLAR